MTSAVARQLESTRFARIYCSIDQFIDASSTPNEGTGKGWSYIVKAVLTLLLYRVVVIKCSVKLWATSSPINIKRLILSALFLTHMPADPHLKIIKL